MSMGLLNSELNRCSRTNGEIFAAKRASGFDAANAKESSVRLSPQQVKETIEQAALAQTAVAQ
jgi:uncharacterized protein (UPF0335 family)